MELKYITSFFESEQQDKLDSPEFCECSAFSSCGSYYSVGSKTGIIHLIQIPSLKHNMAHAKLKKICTFANQDKDFDPFRCVMIDKCIKSLNFYPGTELNPLLLTCNGNYASIIKITPNGSIKWGSVDTNVPLDQFIPPKKKAKKTAGPDIDVVGVYDDIRFTDLIGASFQADTPSFFTFGSNTVGLWDMYRSIDPIFLLGNQEESLTVGSVNSKFQFLFMVGTKSGKCHIYDTRQQPINLTPLISVDTSEHLSGMHNVDGSSFLSGLAFSPDGIHFATRSFGDFMEFDMRAPQTPSQKIELQWYPKHQRYLSENGLFRDKFTINYMTNTNIITGLCFDEFLIIDTGSGEYLRSALTKTGRDQPKERVGFGPRVSSAINHPFENLIGLTYSESVYFYQFKPNPA